MVFFATSLKSTYRSSRVAGASIVCGVAMDSCCSDSTDCVQLVSSIPAKIMQFLIIYFQLFGSPIINLPNIVLVYQP